MVNHHAIEKVLTGLYLDNDLIISTEYPLRLEDFVEKRYQAIYSALYNLYAFLRPRPFRSWRAIWPRAL